jgi:hypothetical protein
MNIDDRDIVCQQDYTPLSNAELVEAIERYAAIMHTAPLIDFDLEWITGPARALAARVAELESQLAAQQWRPVTEKPEPDQEVEIVIEATFDDYGPGGWTSYGYYFAADYPTGWRPLPPAPQETE